MTIITIAAAFLAASVSFASANVVVLAISIRGDSATVRDHAYRVGLAHPKVAGRKYSEPWTDNPRGGTRPDRVESEE